MATEVYQTRFKGYRNDLGNNFIASDYFRYIENISFDDIDGANKVLFPEEVNTSEFESGYDIDGGFEYTYLDTSNVTQKKYVVVTGGKLVVDALSTATEVTVPLTVNTKCRFLTYNNKLFIFNGVDYLVIYDGSKNIAYQMGAPCVEATTLGGEPNGTYRYRITYTTAGGSDIPGSVSNEITVTNKQITVNIPIGYTGVTGRKIYRTINGGTEYKLLYTVGNNTDLTYTDNINDTALGATIGAISNDQPKPLFGESSFNKLVFAGDTKYPTQIFVGESGLELVDIATYSDTSNIGNDNTAIVAMAQQFSQIVVGTKKNWYLVDVSSTTSVNPTSVNVGAFSGDGVVNIPANEGFPGGVMFISSLKDVRVLNGLTGLIAATINNIETQNWSQVIKGDLDNELSESADVFTYFFNYTYHMVINSIIYTFNIKNNQWSKIILRDNEENLTTVNCLFEFGGELYLGKKGSSYIERMYQDIQYKGVDYTSIIRTASIPTAPQENSYAVTKDVKYFNEVQLFFLPTLNYKLKYKITIDDNITDPIEGEFSCPGGIYDEQYYSGEFYNTSQSGEDYKIVRIQRMGKYLNIELKSEEGIVHFRGYKLFFSIENPKG